VFLTPPKDYGREIRCYIRDPDGHLVGARKSPVGSELRFAEEALTQMIGGWRDDCSI
jgi:hypothetical protein